MFKCALYGTVSKPGQKPNKVVVKTRDKVYYTKVYNEATGKNEDVEIGRGTEIVKEVLMCDEAYELWKEDRKLNTPTTFDRLVEMYSR